MSMALGVSPAIVSRDIPQGGTCKEIFWFLDRKTGDPVDNLSNATGLCQIRTAPADRDGTLVGSGAVSIDPETGKIVVEYDTSVTMLLTEAIYYRDVSITYSDGSVDRIVSGTLATVLEVSRSS